MEELKDILKKAGFVDIVIQPKENSDEIIRSWNFGEGVEKGDPGIEKGDQQGERIRKIEFRQHRTLSIHPAKC